MATPTPTYEQLIALAAGDLPKEQAKTVAAFAQANPQAAAVVNAWQSVHWLARSDDSVEPSSAALARAKAIFLNHHLANSSATESATGWLGAIDRFIARLVYDSRLQPAAVRFAETDDRVTLTFESKDGDVDLMAERLLGEAGATSWRVTGQIGEADSAQREIATIRRGETSPILTAITDAHGGFSFDLPTGEFEVLIRRRQGGPIVLSPIVLK